MKLFFITIYLFFLMIYVAINGYIIHRVWEIKIEGDKTKQSIYIFTFIVGAIIIISLFSLILVGDGS